MSVRRSVILFFLLNSISYPLFADHELQNRNIEKGQTLYNEQCASCHGENLEGEANWRVTQDNGKLLAPPHDETGHTWHHNNSILLIYTQLGGKGFLKSQGIENFNSGMPAFIETLTDDEIWDIIAYIRSTWPERVQKMQATKNPKHKQ